MMKFTGLMSRKKWLQTFLLVFFLVILTGAITYRLALLESHFAHFDDVGVAATVIAAQTAPPPLPRWLPAEAFPFISVPLYWTYAPLPFLATPMLVSGKDSYEETKFRGRLPSLIFTVIATLVVLAIAFRLEVTNPLGLGLLMTTPLIFSREFTIMAVQMHSYAAAATSAAIVVWLTLKDAQRTTPMDWRSGLFRGVIIAGLCYLSYQTVLLVPGYLASLGLRVLKAEPRHQWLAKLFPAGLAGTIFVVGIAPAYFLRIRDVRAVWWNAGPHGEFLFTAPDNPLLAVVEAGRFLAANSWITIQGLISPAAEGSLPALCATAILAGGALIGIFVATRRLIRDISWSAESALAVYAIVTLAILLGFVLAGKLTLSPTRHLVAYLPLLSVLFGWGIWRLLKFFFRTPSSARDMGPAFVAFLFAVAATVVFWSGASEFQAARSDPFQEATLIEIAKRTRADVAVSYEFTEQLALMPRLRALLPVADMDRNLPSSIKGFPQRVLFVSHRIPLTADTCRRFIEKFGADAMQQAKECGKAHRITRLVEKTSDVEVDFSRRTHAGTNGLFVSLLDLRDAAPGN